MFPMNEQDKGEILLMGRWGTKGLETRGRD